MAKKFIVLYANEDGEYSLDYMTTEEIKRDYLNEDHEYPVFDKLPDLGYCGAGILIIDGTVKVPKPKEVVKDWEII